MNRSSSNLILGFLTCLTVVTGCGSNLASLGPVSGTPASPVYPTLVDDFENGALFDYLQRQPITNQMDTYGITNQSIVFSQTVASGGYFWDTTTNTRTVVTGGSNLPGGTPGTSIRMYGKMAANVCCNWPYTQVLLGTNPSGLDITKKAPASTLVFSYKAAGGSVGLIHYVMFNDKTITNYNWFNFQFTPPDNNWHQLTVNFPPDNCSRPPCACVQCFQQSQWGPPSPTNPYIPFGSIKTNVTQIVFGPFTGATASYYDLSIDDVWFN